MSVSLSKSGLEDAAVIHAMQIKAFLPLLENYRDYDTSPANEPIDLIVNRMNQSFTQYYLINSDDEAVGAIRIVKRDNQVYRISPLFVVPEHQGKGIAQQVFAIIEQKYSDAKRWELATVLQEAGNCHLYEKMGYKRTEFSQVVNDKMTLIGYEKIMEIQR
ncbi:GNAT family N-acetyltransferase [Paenibacillus sp. NPDC058174]|uniref:GNAT family N-acetyltransferase n=1 Tax=Paenibacillus sp. NPDC058174 TaxID=3346366 RepID=UPI0036DCE2B9